MKLILAILIVIYVLNPFDIVPDFLIGWGWLDDGVLLYLLWRYILTPMMKEKLTQRLFGQKRQYYQQKETPHVHENRSPRDPYTVLGIKRNASKEEIKSAFKRLANQYHPDKVQHLGEEFRELAEKRFKEIQEAYQQLK